MTIEPKITKIAENITIYISPEMHAKNKSFMKSLVEVNEVIVTSTIVVYNGVFWHTLGWAQNNNYKNQIKK